MIKNFFCLIFFCLLCRSGFNQNLPVERYKLKNGLQVYFIEYGSLPVTAIDVYVNVGKENEPPGLQHLSAITAEALLMGNAQWDQVAQDNLLYELGTAISSSANDNYTRLSTRFLNRDMDQGMELLAAILLHPSFSAKEVRQHINELNDFNKPEKMDISELALKFSRLAVFGTAHPLGRNFFPAQLNKIDSVKVREFFRFNYTPGNTRIVISGKLEKEKLRQLLEKYLGRWKAFYGEINDVAYDFQPIRKKEYFFVNRNGVTQSALLWTKKSALANAKDALAFKMANHIFNIILFKEIRAKEGKTYGIHSSYVEENNNGIYMVFTQTRTEETYNMMLSFDRVLAAFYHQGITEEQLQVVKTALRNNYLSIQAPSQLADFYNPVLYPDPEKRKTYLDEIDKMDITTVNKVVKKYFAPDAYKLVIAGNETALQEQLSKIQGLQKLPLNAIEVDQ